MKLKIQTLACVAALTSFTAGVPSMVQAEETPSSVYGCRHLETRADPSSIEGKEGFIYRVKLDLRMTHTFTDGSIKNLATLSDWLKQHGTTLVYVPIPTKSLAMPDFLPDRAKLYGYDPLIAAEVYDDLIERLRGSGVVTVNLRKAFTDAGSDKPQFFKTDFHWNSEGARQAALAIGETIKELPEYSEVEKTEFETIQKEKVVSFSRMRNNLQRFCKDHLPLAKAFSYETKQVDTAAGLGALDLFGSESSDPIALIGTSFSDSAENNFAGFIRQYSSLGVTNYAVTGGNQFGSILSFLTSSAFRENRPRFLVWENPVYNNLGQYGPAPWVELWAAASRTCNQTLVARAEAGSESYITDISDVDYSPEQALMIDANDELVRAVTVEAQYQNGKSRKIVFDRPDRLRSTGRFYMPLMPISHDKILQMKVDFGRPTEGAPTLQLCSY